MSAYELKVITHIAAAHQLTMVGAKCENLHGHNWKIEVCVIGEELNAAGVLLDFGIIKQHVRDICEELDHRFLNQLDCFAEGTCTPPSSENIARHIARTLQARMDDLQIEPAVRVSRVSAWESENACATFFPGHPVITGVRG